MNNFSRAMGAGIACAVLSVSVASGQSSLADVMARHGVQIKGDYAAAFEAHAMPTVPVTPGTFATPLALLTASTGKDRIDAAYAFGILAGRSGRAASPQEVASAAPALVMMIGDNDRRARIAGARVAGRLFAVPFERSGARPALPAGLSDALFALLNREAEVDQLLAMDALGLVRTSNAVVSLTERYYFYREQNKRALAGGALEALARIGDARSAAIVKQVAADPWASGKDATALAVAFARERLLKDGSISLIQQALEDRSRRDQARGYLEELGAPVP